jgi:hypothetical protein
MASNNYIYKMSNAGGMSTVTRYTDMLAGNTTWNPWEPAGAYDSIATATASGSATTLTFSSIPSTYTHLQVRFIGRSGYTLGGGPDNWNLSFNSDTTGTNYYRHTLRGNGSSVDTPTGNDNIIVSSISTAADAANLFGVGVMDILDYANVNKNKTVRLLSGIDYNGSGFVQLESVLWKNTAAITSITFTQNSNWASGSKFYLYGIRGN